MVWNWSENKNSFIWWRKINSILLFLAERVTLNFRFFPFVFFPLLFLCDECKKLILTFDMRTAWLQARFGSWLYSNGREKRQLNSLRSFFLLLFATKMMNNNAKRDLSEWIQIKNHFLSFILAQMNWVELQRMPSAWMMNTD